MKAIIKTIINLKKDNLIILVSLLFLIFGIFYFGPITNKAVEVNSVYESHSVKFNKDLKKWKNEVLTKKAQKFGINNFHLGRTGADIVDYIRASENYGVIKVYYKGNMRRIKVKDSDILAPTNNKNKVFIIRNNHLLPIFE